MSPNNSKSLTSLRNTKLYVGNQWKSIAKHYPRIHPDRKAFGQTPFCMSTVILLQTTPYVIATVITIYHHIFSFQNRKEKDTKFKSADVILPNFSFLF